MNSENTCHSFHDLGGFRNGRDPEGILKRVGYTIHKILDIRKFSAKWVHKFQNVDMKHDQGLATQATVDQFLHDNCGTS
jgi:hypothetical protein